MRGMKGQTTGQYLPRPIVKQRSHPCLYIDLPLHQSPIVGIPF